MDQSMEPMSQLNPSPIFRFAEFVNEQKKGFVGRNGRDERKEFLPRTVLARYWTTPKIQAVLNGYSPHLITNVEVIKARYLRAFSTLVYANTVQCLTEFTQEDLSDERLPREKFPSCWPESPIHKELFTKFAEHQWMFFPLMFDSARLQGIRVSPEQILPLRLEKTLRQGDAARVCKIELYDSCNAIQKVKNDSTPNAFVLKTYKGDRFRLHYQNEVRALTVLQNNPSEHVVTYYGSFVQGGDFNILLEYINGGNLLDYYKRTPPPECAEDVLHFWKSISHIFQGLHRVHQETSESESAEYRLVHEDMKPDNILITKSLSHAPYEFSPKVADFGYSHVRLVHPQTGDGLGLDRHGNQTYCAPECSHHAKWLRKGTNRISSEADIFSAGAILSDAAAWVVWGADGRREYLKQRIQASNLEPEFKDSGYEGCFHDGVERLQVVDKVHEWIIETIRNSRPFDLVTERVIHLAQEYMLLRDATKRLKASQVYQKFEQLLQEAEHDVLGSPVSTQSNSLSLFSPGGRASPPSETGSTVTPSSSNGHRRVFSGDSKMSSFSTDGNRESCGTPSSSQSEQVKFFPNKSGSEVPVNKDQMDIDEPQEQSSPTIGTNRPVPDSNRQSTLSRSTSGPVLKLPQAQAYRKAKKAGQVLDEVVDTIVKQLQTNLDGRDHLIFIDDSETMEQYKSQVLDAFETLSYIAKSIDTNGIELAFASKPKEVFKSKRTSHLTSILRRHKYTHIPDLMENKLGHLFDSVIIPRLPRRILNQKISFGCKPMTIFVFTDGRWGMESKAACGVENPVKDLMNEIIDRRLNRTEVMLQFIRFGEDEDGKRHLTYLDDFGEEVGCDIVDSQPITGNVYSMFLGAISQNNDRESGP